MASTLLITLAGFVLLFGSSYLAYRIKWFSLPVIILAIGVIVFIQKGWHEANTFIIPLIIGTTAGLTIGLGGDVKKYIISSSLLLAISLSGGYYYQLNVNKIDMVQESKIEMERLLDNNKAPEDIKNQMISDFEKYRGVISDIMPFSSFLYGLVLSSLAFLGLRVLSQLLKHAKEIIGLEFFRLNDYIILVFIASWAAFLIFNKESYHALNAAALNIALITTVFYIIQALGVIKYFVISKNLPTYIIPMVLIVFFFMGIHVLLFLVILMAGIGTLDFWADFRKLEITKDTRSEQ